MLEEENETKNETKTKTKTKNKNKKSKDQNAPNWIDRQIMEIAESTYSSLCGYAGSKRREWISEADRDCWVQRKKKEMGERKSRGGKVVRMEDRLKKIHVWASGVWVFDFHLVRRHR